MFTLNSSITLILNNSLDKNHQTIHSEYKIDSIKALDFYKLILKKSSKLLQFIF
jgi:hypothetical protein